VPAAPCVESAAVGSGEGEEILGQAAQLVGLLQRALQRALHLGAGARPVTGQLELAPQDRQWRAELVAGVVDEGALPGQRRLDPLQHGVERAPQVGDLVVAGRLLKALAGLGQANRAGLLGDAPVAAVRRRPAPNRYRQQRR